MHITDTPAEAYRHLEAIVAGKPDGYGYDGGQQPYAMYFRPGGGCLLGEYFSQKGLRESDISGFNATSLPTLVDKKLITFEHVETYVLLKQAQHYQDLQIQNFVSGLKRHVHTWREVLAMVSQFAPKQIVVEPVIAMPEKIFASWIASGDSKPLETLATQPVVTFEEIVAQCVAEPKKEEDKELVAA